jgi:hypothetical protein
LAGELGVTLLSVVVATVSADSTAAALVRDSGERGAFSSGSFSGRGDQGCFGDRGFRSRERDFRGRRFPRLLETFSI